MLYSVTPYFISYFHLSLSLFSFPMTLRVLLSGWWSNDPWVRSSTLYSFPDCCFSNVFQGFCSNVTKCYLMLPRLGAAHRSLGESPPEPMFSQGFCMFRSGNPPAPGGTTRGAVETPQSRIARIAVLPRIFKVFGLLLPNVTCCYLPPYANCCFSKDFQGFLHDFTWCYLMHGFVACGPS